MLVLHVGGGVGHGVAMKGKLHNWGCERSGITCKVQCWNGLWNCTDGGMGFLRAITV